MKINLQYSPKYIYIYSYAFWKKSIYLLSFSSFKFWNWHSGTPFQQDGRKIRSLADPEALFRKFRLEKLRNASWNPELNHRNAWPSPVPDRVQSCLQPPCIARSFNRCVLSLLEWFPRANDTSFLCGPRARHPIYWHDPCPIPRGLVERLDIILYADERESALENGILYEKSANTDLPVPAMKPDRQFFVRSLFCIIYARPCISIRSLIQQPHGHAKCSP